MTVNMLNDKAEKIRLQYEMFMKSKKADKGEEVSSPAIDIILLSSQKVEHDEKK